MAERHYPSFSDSKRCACGLVTGHADKVEISLEHMQRLSRVFNEGCNLHTRNDQQINEWLKYQISLRA